jgi:hypothetical protein
MRSVWELFSWFTTNMPAPGTTDVSGTLLAACGVIGEKATFDAGVHGGDITIVAVELGLSMNRPTASGAAISGYFG